MDSEFSLIHRLLERLPVEAEDVVVAAGDDAAVLRPRPGEDLVLCTDTLIEDVHFPAQTDGAAVGWKAVAVNLSDLAAMGAAPRGVLLALSLPTLDAQWLDGLAEGLAEICRAFELPVLGGDTTRGPVRSITVQAVGGVPAGKALCRRGARPGDRLAVTGCLGDAALALRLLQRDGRESVPEGLLARLDRPMPRIRVGQALLGRASACIDLSDGLLADAGHLADASGVAIELDPANFPRSADFSARAPTAEASRLQLCGGDDYELCFSFAPADEAGLAAALAEADLSWRIVGSVREGRGVTLRGEDREFDFGGGGYDHFKPR